MKDMNRHGREGGGDQSVSVGPKAFAGSVEITLAELGTLWNYYPHWKWQRKIRKRSSISTEFNFWQLPRESHP